MGSAQNPTWYVLDPTGRANMHHTEEDAWETAHGFDAMWPAYGPHRPVRIYTEDDFNKEVKARIKAQNELAQLRNQLAGQMAAALSEPEPADTPTGWLYTNVRSLRKKYIAHRAGLPEALLDLDPVALYSRPQR